MFFFSGFGSYLYLSFLVHVYSRLFSLSDTYTFRGISSNDFPCLETLCKKIIKEKQPFERLEVKKETLLEMFKVP